MTVILWRLTMFGSKESRSDSFIECERRLRDLHALIRKGAGDTVEADDLRDEMDVFWYRLESEEVAALDTLSAELNKLIPK